MSRCVARTKDLERCRNYAEKGSIFCRRHRWWWLITLIAILVTVTTICANISTMFNVTFPNPLTWFPTFTNTRSKADLEVFSMRYPFENTKIYIEKGDKIEIAVLGDNPTWNCGRIDLVSPDGFANEKYADTVYSQANACALIGSISTSSPERYFLVGSQSSFIASETGFLYLGCNDSKERFADNPSDSSLDVKITVRKGLNIIPVIFGLIITIFIGFASIRKRHQRIFLPTPIVTLKGRGEQIPLALLAPFATLWRCFAI